MGARTMCRAMTLFLSAGVLTAPSNLWAEQGRQAETARAEVSVRGEASPTGTYSLALDVQPGTTERADAVLVFAEPSHTLLLVHWNGPAGNRSAQATELPLVTTEGEFGRSAPRVVVAYAPGADTTITVQVLYGTRLVTVSQARVNVAAFGFTTAFATDGDLIRHCCTCGDCGKMCVECEDSYFSCDCVACTIHCGW